MTTDLGDPMSIKTKMKVNLNLFLIMSSYMILEWYEADLANYVKSLMPVIAVS